VTDGIHVDVRSKIDRNGNLVAEWNTVQSSSTRSSLQAPVAAFDAMSGTMTILGTAKTSDAGTEYRVSSTVTETAVTRRPSWSR
jgi:hypothetical protein